MEWFPLDADEVGPAGRGWIMKRFPLNADEVVPAGCGWRQNGSRWNDDLEPLKMNALIIPVFHDADGRWSEPR